MLSKVCDKFSITLPVIGLARYVPPQIDAEGVIKAGMLKS